MADGQVTDIPRATFDDPMGNARFSDRWIEDASYLKFKRLMLSYRVPVRSTSFLQGSIGMGGSEQSLHADEVFGYGS